MKQLVMGNAAIAHGALRAGVGLAAGYPGTPSTEIIETLARLSPPNVHLEWSVNEKAAMEVAAGAAYAGTRTLVTMKQVGLNVAADPLMSLAYVGVKGGMVVVVADDPGPISSQTEQDTRSFARFSKLPVFDPASPEEAYEMVGDAFELSERLGTPVLLRPTTRVCHACAVVDLEEPAAPVKPEGFIKDARWVIFPRLSYANHQKIEARNAALSETLSTYRFNTTDGTGRIGIAAGGMGYAYACEALAMLGADLRMLRVATPFPFPETLAVDFLQQVDRVLVLEELDPVIERELCYLCGRKSLPVQIAGKLTGEVPVAGELSAVLAARAIAAFAGLPVPALPVPPDDLPLLAVRPPVLCPGCPHRASFYAVKRAMRGRKAVFSGDIGCYTLGNALPLDMVDTCLCMGAGITIAQGLSWADPETVHIAFVGDSTFFASGLTGIVNAVYNQSNIVLVVLDNSTTAMTGQQPHPGTGITAPGTAGGKLDIGKVLQAFGVGSIEHVNPFDQQAATLAVQRAADLRGVRAILFEAPCVAMLSAKALHVVNPDLCVGCGRCVSEIGCPALSMQSGKAVIDMQLCNGCGLCTCLCSTHAIAEQGGDRT